MSSNETTEISSSHYAARRKELLSLVTQLRAIGAQSDLDLPRITVIGKQSAGKSSVVEAISGITVPRDVGTCTRCPMECRMLASSGPWSCRISIRFEFDKNGKRLDEVFEVQFGSLITNKSEVEPALRRAQFAVLNPHISPSAVWSTPLSDLENLNLLGSKSSLSFSRNVVCIDLKGPELTDLSFIDLPGLIQNAATWDVHLVEDLVISQIKGNCLILVALTVTDDIENQKALLLAQQADPEGLRTIGVLTKPDMLPSGSIKAHNMWLDVIEGRTHSLKHGYYCTRRPDDSERDAGITPAEASAAEAKFFANNLPWSASSHQQRLGIENLVATLSKLLIQVIKKSLPSIQSEAYRHLQICRRDLDSLPPAIGMPLGTYMMTLLTRLCEDFQQYVRGGCESSRLIHDNRDAYAAFKTSIRKTAPNFVPQPNGNGANALLRRALADDDEEAEDLITEMEPLYLNDRHIAKSVTRELPGNVPYPAKVVLIAASQKTWPMAATNCFDHVRNSLMQILSQCIDENSKQHELLRGPLTSFADELVEKCYDTCLQFLNATLEIEVTPYTQNHQYLESSTSKWLAKYKEARATPPVSTDLRWEKKDFFATSTPHKATTTSSFSPPTFSTANAQSSTPFTGWPSTTPKMSTRLTDRKQRSERGLSKLPFSFSANSLSDPSAPLLGSTLSQSQNTTSPPQSTRASTVVPVPMKDAPSHSASPSSFIPFWEKPQSAQSEGTTVSTPAVATKPHPFSAFSSQAEASATPLPANMSFRAEAQASPGVRASTSIVPERENGAQEHSSKDRKLDSALAVLADLGYTGLTEEDLGKLHPPDEYETELKFMAEIRGYFQVSYKRIIDAVPAMIDHKFVREVGKQLLPFLIAKFELGTPTANESCAAYLAEDPSLTLKREELIGRKKRLEKVQMELRSFGL